MYVKSKTENICACYKSKHVNSGNTGLSRSCVISVDQCQQRSPEEKEEQLSQLFLRPSQQKLRTQQPTIHSSLPVSYRNSRCGVSNKSSKWTIQKTNTRGRRVLYHSQTKCVEEEGDVVARETLT